MGNVIKWSISKESSYDLVMIYRSDEREETYNLIKTQDISDNSYFDVNGGSNDWYKVRFQDSTTGVYSQYSSSIAGGKFSGYCNVDDIRNFSSKMTSNTISDSVLFELIKIATAQINQDILVEYRDENVLYIDVDKKNTIDGINKTFYVKNLYLADYNDDGIIDENDIYVFSKNSLGVRTEYVVDEIDDVRHGQFTLTTAPNSNEELYITYRSSPVLLYPKVNMNVRNAAINYVLALAHMRLDPNQMRSFRVNKVSVTGDSSPSKAYMEKYTNYISKINSKLIREQKVNNIV